MLECCCEIDVLSVCDIDEIRARPIAFIYDSYYFTINYYN